MVTESYEIVNFKCNYNFSEIFSQKGDSLKHFTENVLPSVNGSDIRNNEKPNNKEIIK